MVPKDGKVLMNYMFIICENVIPVLIGSSYFYFGGKDWASPFMISLVLPILGTILLMQIPKSPLYLLEKGQVQEAEKELHKIAKFNGKSLPYEFQIYAPEIPIDQTDSLTLKKRKLLTTCSYFCRLLLSIMLSIHANAMQVMLWFYVKNLSLNIFLVNMIDCGTSTTCLI